MFHFVLKFTELCLVRILLTWFTENKIRVFEQRCETIIASCLCFGAEKSKFET